MVAEVGNINCLSSQSKQLDVIERVGISLEGAKRDEKKLVARFVHTLIEMTNEQHATSLLSGLKIVFEDILGNTSAGGCMPAHQLVKNQIHMGRFCVSSKGKNLEIPNKDGILIHEIGHFVANKRGFYGEYNKEVKRSCKLSNYMRVMTNGKKHKNRNEEFAEVFSSYFIFAKSLKRKCKQSYEFMKEKLFLDSPASCLN